MLKRTTDFDGVPVMGSIHGILFVLYVIFWADAWSRTSGARTAALYFILSVLPTGGFFAERKLRRESEDAVIASVRAARES